MTRSPTATGRFQFMNVKAGRYEIAAHGRGLRHLQAADPVQLEARQTLRADLSLKVKSASEVIEVGESAPMINTESATLADTKDFLQVSQLPVNYRGATTSSMAVLDTVPGTQQDANGNVSVGGGLPSQVQYSVDGASTVNIRQNGALGNMNPSSELISEFRVSQFNNNAEFAQLGDITIATKSGNDQLPRQPFRVHAKQRARRHHLRFHEQAAQGFQYIWRQSRWSDRDSWFDEGNAAHVLLSRLSKETVAAW